MSKSVHFLAHGQPNSNVARYDLLEAADRDKATEKVVWRQGVNVREVSYKPEKLSTLRWIFRLGMEKRHPIAKQGDKLLKKAYIAEATQPKYPSDLSDYINQAEAAGRLRDLEDGAYILNSADSYFIYIPKDGDGKLDKTKAVLKIVFQVGGENDGGKVDLSTLKKTAVTYAVAKDAIEKRRQEDNLENPIVVLEWEKTSGDPLVSIGADTGMYSDLTDVRLVKLSAELIKSIKDKWDAKDDSLGTTKKKNRDRDDTTTDSGTYAAPPVAPSRGLNATSGLDLGGQAQPTRHQAGVTPLSPDNVVPVNLGGDDPLPNNGYGAQVQVVRAMNQSQANGMNFG